ncbi:regucalcin-like [Belonocnema kinseyi]|uniref:regucalcin-like n=1 Tax=Belonocnema kinseyi TaxID=2817044 RepID=UPI00143CE9FE|nr:regucalcin-like [Belonocnema kinseyi]
MATAGQNDPSIVIEQVVNRTNCLTEGPHWDPKTQRLIFVDIWANKICSYDPANKKVLHAELAKPVGVAVPVENSPNLFLAAHGTDLVLVTWDCTENVKNPPIKILESVEKGRKGNRFNDGKCDPSGRFWAGTMCEIEGNFEPNQGSLYSLDSNLDLKSHFSSVGISNGLAWKDDKFYYIDSLTFEVAGFDYDSKSGTIANRKVVFDFKENNISGFPDGMTIDANGNLWVACWDGSRILQIDPKSGKLLQTIYIPAKRVTSVAFGGPALDTLFVTTAGYGFNIPEEKTPADDPKGGSIFAVKGLGVTGLPANCFKMNV